VLYATEKWEIFRTLYHQNQKLRPTGLQNANRNASGQPQAKNVSKQNNKLAKMQDARYIYITSYVN
jgi:hypothetical protein